MHLQEVVAHDSHAHDAWLGCDGFVFAHARCFRIGSARALYSRDLARRCHVRSLLKALHLSVQLECYGEFPSVAGILRTLTANLRFALAYEVRCISSGSLFAHHSVSNFHSTRPYGELTNEPPEQGALSQARCGASKQP